MDPLTSAVDNLKYVVKSGQNFVSGLIRANQKSSPSCNPIEILKRLQREAFSDIMKLRDKQDKMERMLTFYRTSKGIGPFQEDSTTRVKGEVDLLAALLLVNDPKRLSHDEISRAGIRTGGVSRITFETRVREKDTLEAEFIAGLNGQGYGDESVGSMLSLARVGYTAHFASWLSLSAFPMGARCKDVAVNTSSSFEDRGLTDYSSYGPPFLHQQYGGAIGLMVKKPNAVASLAQFDSELQMHPTSTAYGDCFSTFGQVACKLSKSIKLSLFGLHQVPKFSLQGYLGPLTIPLRTSKSPSKTLETRTVEPSAPPFEARSLEIPSTVSVAFMLESELDESTRLGGWVQVKNSNPKCIQWSVSLSNSPEDETGWGLSLGGMLQGPDNQEHLQAEACLKFKVGERFTLQPGIVYHMDGVHQMPAIMFRSNWML